jgi:hypothetical protein
MNIIEVVSFKLMSGTREDEFAVAAQYASDFLRRQPGFIARRLSKGNDDNYVDHVEWASMREAKAAAELFMQDADLAPFMKAMDPTTIVMHHNVLVASAG